MAIYNVESPGGYQLTGLTIPGVDLLGSKKGYSALRPWLFEDFDQLTFYPVSEEEYERQLAVFESGRYEYEIEDVEFDMAEHNKLLEDTREEVREMKERQRRAQEGVDRRERELLEKWENEKKAGRVSVDKVEALLGDPGIGKVEAPLNANVWKVEVEEGSKVNAETVVVILEAMKLEIAVKVEGLEGKVEKVLAWPGETVKAGEPLVLIRKE